MGGLQPRRRAAPLCSRDGHPGSARKNRENPGLFGSVEDERSHGSHQSSGRRDRAHPVLDPGTLLLSSVLTATCRPLRLVSTRFPFACRWVSGAYR
jgi:hypothetical protein